MIQTRRSYICIRAVHAYQSVFEELKHFVNDLLALSSERLPLAEDVGMAICKSSYCGDVSTLFGCIFGIPSPHDSSFFLNVFFVTLYVSCVACTLLRPGDSHSQIFQNTLYLLVTDLPVLSCISFSKCRNVLPFFSICNGFDNYWSRTSCNKTVNTQLKEACFFQLYSFITLCSWHNHTCSITDL